MSNIILSLSDIQLLCHNTQLSILAILESYHINIEYQCRSGFCGSCRCRLITGQVDWFQEPLAFVHDGEILTCCCRAKGDIEIEI